jgi:GNAT superfamily N-acetyltransferase
MMIGTTRVSISPYVPNYFTPGPDVAAYAPGIDFLMRRGFTEIERPISMRAELTGYQEDAAISERRAALAAQGIEVRPVTPADIVPLLEFVREHFSADWLREATGVLNDLYNGDGRFVGMVIARQGDRVLGYAEHRNERFGPFGVREDQRGGGIGRVLLSITLAEMLKKNVHAAWFLWTGDDAARLYARCGFHSVRRFSVLTKEL